MTTILITNDDGFGSAGIAALEEAMAELGTTVVVAPDTDNSAVSHSLTINRPIRIIERGERQYSINGTPSDCVVLAIQKILDTMPDLVVSGINHGINVGDDVHYSGTVAAAIESSMQGCQAIAFSAQGKEKKDFQRVIPIARQIAARILENPMPSQTLLNVNFPKNAAIDKIHFTCQGRRLWQGGILETFDPAGIKHYWIGGGSPRPEESCDTDVHAVGEGNVSITPIHIDLTHYETLSSYKKSWQAGNMK